MNVIAFNGSPAGESSATYRIISAFLKGAERAGAQTKNYHLSDYQIRQCRGCFSCWFRTPGMCVLQDDMHELLRAYTLADIVCYASPVYSWNMTALLKNFVDRLIPLKHPRIIEDNDNFDMEDAVRRQQKYVTISNCGFPGENNFSVIKAAFSCCNPCLEIYRNCGKALITHNERILQRTAPFLAAVESAGYELVAQGEVCKETRQALCGPVMSVQEYVSFLGM